MAKKAKLGTNEAIRLAQRLAVHEGKLTRITQNCPHFDEEKYDILAEGLCRGRVLIAEGIEKLRIARRSQWGTPKSAPAMHFEGVVKYTAPLPSRRTFARYEILCGLRSYEHDCTKEPKEVTCKTCKRIIEKNKSAEKKKKTRKKKKT